jgi:hypothetical protein
MSCRSFFADWQDFAMAENAIRAREHLKESDDRARRGQH